MSLTESASAEAGPSRPSAPICSICHSSHAKYTCPRCSLRTCSVNCSKTHKTQSGCSGQRDPAKFVSLKDYGQGAWADDYRWLEEGRRKVRQWGEGVKIEEVNPNHGHLASRGRGGRGAFRGGGGGGGRRSKTDGLRRELQKRGCEVDFMPEGMGKRKANQSSWNPKTQQLYVSLQLSIPAHLLDPPLTQSEPKLFMHPRALFFGPDSTALPSLQSLLPSSINATDIIFALPFSATPSRPGPEHKHGQRLFYPPLDGSKPLAVVLKGTAWVEFPVVHVYTIVEWKSRLEKDEIVIVPLADFVARPEEQRDNGWGQKRRQQESTVQDEVTVKKPKVADGGLLALGEYDSDDDEDEQQDIVENLGVGIQDDVTELHQENLAMEDDPPLEVLQAVGAAITADFGE